MCQVSEKDVPFRYNRDGIELKSGGKYRIIQDEDKVELIIKGVSPADAGDITCEIVNPKGRDSATARLVVQSESLFDALQ